MKKYALLVLLIGEVTLAQEKINWEQLSELQQQVARNPKAFLGSLKGLNQEEKEYQKNPAIKNRIQKRKQQWGNDLNELTGEVEQAEYQGPVEMKWRLKSLQQQAQDMQEEDWQLREEGEWQQAQDIQEEANQLWAQTQLLTQMNKMSRQGLISEEQNLRKGEQILWGP